MKKYLLPRDEIKEETVVALGDFDGVHKAHRVLLCEAVRLAKDRGVSSLVYTFNISNKKSRVITPAHIKEELIDAVGVDIFAVQETNEQFFSTSCEDFVKRIIKEKLNAKIVVAGRNYTFGKGGAGTSETLEKLCKKEGIQTIIIDDILEEGEPVSSSRIRRLLKEGKIEEANNLLGYNYIIKGRIEKGKQLGRKLGFPTANIYPGDSIELPEFGVYVAEAELDKIKAPAIVNIGIRPTVNGENPSVEAFIKGAEGDLYGKEIKLCLLRFIRREKKFSSIEELKRQIKKDVADGGLL